MASKEVSLCSPGLYWATINRGLVQGRLGVFNVGFCEVLDLREASKGEVVTVGIALYSISNSLTFLGIGKTLISSNGIALGVGRNSEGV